MDVVWEHYLDDVPAISAADISSIEQSTGLSLPSDVQSLLQSRAGQVTQPETITLSDKGHTTVFGPILVPLSKTKFANYTYSVSFAIDALKEWQGNKAVGGATFFPIATNTASGWFCLEYRQASVNPGIVFIDTGYDPDEAGAISFVAKDVKELLQKLR